jgi:hypothetical protein
VRTMEDAVTVLRQASRPLGPMGAEWLKAQEQLPDSDAGRPRSPMPQLREGSAAAVAFLTKYFTRAGTGAGSPYSRARSGWRGRRPA